MRIDSRSGSGEFRLPRKAAAVAALVMGLQLATAPGALSQENPVLGSAVTMSAGEATLELDLAGGETRTITFRDGNVIVDGTVSGSYEPGGSLESSWRELLRDPDILDADVVDDLLLAWSPPAGANPVSAGAISGVLSALAPPTPGAIEVAGDVAVGDLGGGEVAIAPGIRSLDGLTRSMRQLHETLARIGSQSLVSGDDVALVIHDDYTIVAGQVIDGDLALLDGDVLLAGTVRGDVIILDGSMTLAEGSAIEGDLLQVGGDLIHEGGRVLGELVSVSFAIDELAELEELEGLDLDLDVAVAPDVKVRSRHSRPGFFGRIGHNIGHAIGGLAAVVGWLIVLGALGALFVYFFRGRLEVVADTARLNITRSFGVGLAGELLFVPIGLVLVVGIVTWLVIPFYVLAAAIAIPAGYIAVAHAAGEVVESRRYDLVERLKFSRSNSYWYVWIGLIVLLAPFAIGSAMYLLGGFLGFLRGLAFFAGGVITWAAITTGFGAILLSRGGSTRDYAQGSTSDLFGDMEEFAEENPGA